jgi:hypothetical protein
MSISIAWRSAGEGGVTALRFLPSLSGRCAGQRAAHRSARQRLSACDVGHTDVVGDTGSGAEKPAASTHTDPDPAGWLVLVYRIPSDPTRLRATVWRRLKSLGAVYLQNSAAALPASDAPNVRCADCAEKFWR